MAIRRRRRSRLPGTPKKGVVHPQRRVRVLLVGTLIVFSLFAAQLVKLQGLDAARVSAAAFDGRKWEQVLPAPRGAITDAFGQPLAESIERKHITADPTAVVSYRKRVDGSTVTVGIPGAARDIAAVTGADADRLQRAMEANAESRFLYLVKDVSPQTWQEVRALGIPGIHFEDYLKRTYPLGIAPAPIVGWVGSGGLPAGGVELVYEDTLTGEPGRTTYERGGFGEIITTGTTDTVPAVPGQDVRLTLDSDLQWYAYDAVKTRVKEAGALSGYAIVTRPDGEILALAEYPSFDPNKPSQQSADMRAAAIEDAYEPGSTGKLIVAAAALELGLVEAETPIILPAGHRLPRGGTTFKDSVNPRNNFVTFAGALATSTNMGTILYGEHIPDDVLYEYMTRFGMGSASGLGLPGESPGLIHKPEDWSRTTKYTMLFGQGLTSNALQQHSVFQTFANGGVLAPPSIVAGTTDAEGRFHPAATPESRRVVDPEVSQLLSDIMESVPTWDGTAPLAAVEGYRVAGKTSTADRVDPVTGRYSSVTSAFIGYAPAEDPEFVISVVLQRPTRISKYGGTIAGPVFSDIMRYALQKYQIPPSTEPAPEFELRFDPEDPAPGEPPGVTLGDIAIQNER